MKNKKLLIVGLILGIIFISGYLKEKSVKTVGEGIGDDQLYLRECANSLNEAKNKIGSQFKIVTTIEEENCFLIKAYYQVEEKKYPYSYCVPRCDYIEMLSNNNPTYEIEDSQCNNTAYAILKVKDIDKSDASNGVIFYWNMLNSQVQGYNITFNNVNEKNHDFIVTLKYTSFVGGDWGMCDYWYLWEDDYCVNKNNGNISLNKRKILEKKKGECH